MTLRKPYRQQREVLIHGLTIIISETYPGIQQVGDGLPDTIRRTVHIDLGVNSTIFLNKSLNVQGTLSLSSAKVVLGNHNLANT